MAAAPSTYASSLIAALRGGSAGRPALQVPSLQFMPNAQMSSSVPLNFNAPLMTGHLQRYPTQTMAPVPGSPTRTLSPVISGSSQTITPRLTGNLMPAPEMTPMQPYVPPPKPEPQPTTPTQPTVLIDENGYPVYYDEESGTYRRVRGGEGE